MANIINTRSMSFESIKADLLAHVAAKPDSAKWISKLESNIGTTVLELIAGLGVYQSYHQMIARREQYLDEAQLETSINELAFGRGFIVPPADSGELVLHLSGISTNIVVHAGDQIGTFFDYNLYALEDKVLNTPSDTITCIAGWMEEFNQQLGNTPFSTLEYVLAGEIAEIQLEKLQIVGGSQDGEEITLKDSTDLDLSINLQSTSFMLRRWKRNKIKLYTGDGVLGWFTSLGSLNYRVISYNPDIVSKVNSSSHQITSLITGATVNELEVIRVPSTGMDKETIRNLAEFYPADGRIIRDKDYELIILKYFTDKIWDVYSWNNDPDQIINILVKDGFDNDDLDAIKEAVDFRRGMGIKINYNTHEVSTGITLTFAFNVDESEFSNELVTDVNAYLADKKYKFMRESTTITAVDIAVELSAEFEVEFNPVGSETYTLETYDFINDITITYS